MLNDDQQKAMDVVLSGRSLLITGPGGCGKTYIIQHLRETLKDKIVAITALTGVAATLISGQTLHSWSGIGINVQAKEITLQYLWRNDEAIKRWKSTEILVIDEVSMLSLSMFNKLNWIAQRVRGSNNFFGGLQVVFSGDFCQLSPVDFDGYCFQSNEWKTHVKDIVCLNKIVRQGDPDLQKVLNNVRLGIIDEGVKKLLLSRVFKTEKLVDLFNARQFRATRLYPHNADVDKINELELSTLCGKDVNHVREFIAIDDISVKHNPEAKITSAIKAELETYLNNSLNVPTTIKLVEGAQVMLTYNLDVEKGLVNGACGLIQSFKQDGQPVVKFTNGQTGLAEPFGSVHVITNTTWIVDHPKYHIERKQIPLVLAWAMTIHKTQGATLPYVQTNLKDVFLPGQAYVALSRVKELNGLFIEGINLSKIKCHPKVIEFYRNHK
jgi:ATP-dependent DNA helicase PIF1